MFKKLATYALATYLALAPVYSAQAEPKHSANFNGSTIVENKKKVTFHRKDPVRQLFGFLEGCRASTSVKRELSSATLTDTTIPLLGGLEVMLDTQMISGKKIVPRTGVRYYLKKNFIRLYVQGVVDLQNHYQQELLTSARFSHRFDEKMGVNLDLSRIDSFGKEHLVVNQFRFGANYRDLELGIGGDVKEGNSYGYTTVGFLKYYF